MGDDDLSHRPGRTRSAPPDRFAALLRLVGAAATLVVAVLVAVVWWSDAGAFLLVLTGVPVVAVAPVVLLTTAGRPAAVVTWSAALVVLPWGVLTGLGAGAWFTAPGLVLLAAALVSTPALRSSRAH